MAVLTLTGKPIDWAKPPKATARVMWSQRTTSGKKITGSFRTIAQLDRLNGLCKKRFGHGFVVYQGPYNTGVSASAGSHDYDAVKDVWIPGVAPATQQAFFRANGEGCFSRTKAQGFDPHQHMFTLPPLGSADVSRRWEKAGFKVGYLVDGGWSVYGHDMASSQIADYYAKPPRNALKGHARDNTWHPPNIDATVFNLAAYVRAKQAALPSNRPLPQKPSWRNPVHLDSHGYMDYRQAIDTAAAQGRGVDVDEQPDMQGTLWGLHWQDITKNGLYDPSGKIEDHTLLLDLTTAQVLTLRDRATGKRRAWKITYLLDRAYSKRVRVEVEMKKMIPTAIVKRLLARPATKAMNKAGLLQFKALAEMPGSVTKMMTAHNGGGVTLLSFTDYTGSGISKTAWPYIDYTRGAPKWVA